MRKTILMLAIAALCFSTAAQAALINRGTDTLGNRLIYDDDLNITWYDYSNYRDTWQNQRDWASNLSVTFGSQTFDDWRLPSTVDGAYVWGYDGTTTAGYNITSSEMGHLYYTELGNLGYHNTSGGYQPGHGLNNTGPFQYLLSSHHYWSGTASLLNPDYAWDFLTRVGFQDVDTKDDTYMYALAVRDGDVSAAQHTNPVPEPGTWMLLGAGLVAVRKKFAGIA